MNAFNQIMAETERQLLDRSLSIALRIANLIGDDELISWIRLELMGYLAENPAMTENTVVPPYRTVPGQWYDDYDRPFVVEDPKLTFINEIRLHQGATELQGLGTAKSSLAVRQMELSDIIRRELDVAVSVFRFQPRSVNQVLTNIKLELLDQLTKRWEKIAALPELEQPVENEILRLRPELYGVSVDLKALWRRLFKPKK